MTLRDKIAKIVRTYDPLTSLSLDIADAIEALPEISDLQKKLAEVEAERDLIIKAATNQSGQRCDACQRAGFHHCAYVDECGGMRSITARETVDEIERIYARAEAAEAVLPRAYQMGLDAGVKYGPIALQMKPPADLVERAKGGRVMSEAHKYNCARCGGSGDEPEPKEKTVSDDRPCSTDIFLVHLLEYEDDHFDRTDRIRCWLHGDWDGALEDLPDLPKGTDPE